MHLKENATTSANCYIAYRDQSSQSKRIGTTLEPSMSKNTSTLKEQRTVILIGLSLASSWHSWDPLRIETQGRDLDILLKSMYQYSKSRMYQKSSDSMKNNMTKGSLLNKGLLTLIYFSWTAQILLMKFVENFWQIVRDNSRTPYLELLLFTVKLDQEELVL